MAPVARSATIHNERAGVDEPVRTGDHDPLDELESLGVAAGSISPDKVEVLRNIEGVANVEEDREVQAS